MTPEQEQHLTVIKERIVKAIDTKYRRGQEEHGGNLWERPVLTELGYEIVDLITYHHCVVDKFKAIHDIIPQLRFAVDMGKFARANNLIDDIFNLTLPEQRK